MSKEPSLKQEAVARLGPSIEIDIPQPPAPPNGPHDSAYTHSQLKGRHTLVVFPTLGEIKKSNMQAVIISLLVLLSVLSAWGLAYEAQVAITPHVPGTCAPPAVIENGGCFNVITSTGSNGATITTLVPAGVLGG